MSIDTTTTQTQAKDGFWSSIGQSLSNTTAELLPIWAASELNLQKSDQLNNATGNYNPNTAVTTQNATSTVSVPGDISTWILIGGSFIALIFLALLWRR